MPRLRVIALLAIWVAMLACGTSTRNDTGDREPVVPAGFDVQLLDILVCPENLSALRFATRAELGSINERIHGHTLRRWNGELVGTRQGAVLIRADGRIAYTVDENVPDLIIEHALVLDPRVGPPDPQGHRAR